jgi:hypothetical protein
MGVSVRKGISAVAATAFVLLAAVPTGAAAKSASTTIASAQLGTVTAKCPRGKRATGGGFTTGTAPGFSSFVLYESRKIGQRSWRVSAHNNSLNTQTLTAFAYCQNKEAAPKTSEESATVQANGANLRPSANAICGRGEKVQSGGLLATAPPVGFGILLAISDSARIGKKTWRAGGVYSSGSTTLTSYAYCAEGNALKERTGSTGNGGNGVSITATSAACKRGTRPLAGGFTQPATTTGPSNVNPFESARVGRQWRASMYANPGSTLIAVGYCG